ncbi:unnamed protein product [Heligmosomoides polygyrus]|uniref:EXPERA domain-containing protein n=1 Tax=Heligmosomoides polygyrus TaxID=6339 RepID=A0A183GK99_HELPZ|nr:unnamed protein product [Heligmosomoides polygyrus]
MLHCYAHALWCLLFSFSYRYYILSHSSPRSPTIVAILLVSFCFVCDDVDMVKEAIETKFHYDMTNECVNGILNIIKWNALFAILHMTLPVAPVYVGILVLRRAVAARLSNALTYQACLPAFFLLPVLIFATEQLNIYQHPLLEYLTFIFIGFVPVLSPLTSFYFIQPYRMWIRNKLLICRSARMVHTESKIPTIQRSEISPA